MDTERIKDAFLRQFVRLRKTAGVVTLGLLIINQALLVAGYVAWRGISIYVIVPSVVLLLGVGAIVLSNVLWLNMGLFHNETSAQVSHNPVNVYALNPFQEMIWRRYNLPELEANAQVAEAVGAHEAADTYRQIRDDWAEWTKLGYIPKDEFPDHLHRHYLNAEGQRL